MESESSSDFLDKLQEALREEVWTRKGVKDYTLEDFAQLRSFVPEHPDEEKLEEGLELCKTHLTTNRSSIVALYLASLIAKRHGLLDISYLVSLLEVFSQQSRWSIVEDLALEFQETPSAAQFLEKAFKEQDETDKLVGLWQNFVAKDLSNIDAVVSLADYHKSSGEPGQSQSLYLKAFNRAMQSDNKPKLKVIWDALLEFPISEGFYKPLVKKMSKGLPPAQHLELLTSLFKKISSDPGELGFSLYVLKEILAKSETNGWARRELIKKYREFYAENPNLEENLQQSNLLQGWRDVNQAIDDFEKHMAFEKGRFVFHSEWGVGYITEVNGDTLSIDFLKKPGHKMSFKMALSSLSVLQKKHIWVLKATQPREKLHDKIKGDPSWALQVIFRSFGVIDMKAVKAELTPDILSASEWTSWATRAKNILTKDSYFSKVPGKANTYAYQLLPLEEGERVLNAFFAETSFFRKTPILRAFLALEPLNSDLAMQFLDFFEVNLNNTSEPVLALCSYLVIQDCIAKFPELTRFISALPTFEELFAKLQDVHEVFVGIKDSYLVRSLTSEITKRDDALEIFKSNFLASPSPMLYEALESTEQAQSIGKEIVAHYKDPGYRSAFIWFVKTYPTRDLALFFDLDHERLLVLEAHLLEVVCNDIRAHRNLIQNRRYLKILSDSLFKSHAVLDMVRSADKPENVEAFFRTFRQFSNVESQYVVELEQVLSEQYPSLALSYTKATRKDKEDAKASENADRDFFWTLSASLEKKKMELKELLEVEVPKNAREIGAAIELGDLKENAEYKAGKERQELLNIQIGKLSREIQRAKVFDPQAMQSEQISFGTVVEVKTSNGQKEKLTMLGLWESNPDKKVISYISPLGTKLIGHKVGETIEFDLSGKSFSYEILGIAPMAAKA